MMETYIEEPMNDVFRWGILGPGAIAKAFATGLAALPDARLVAVGSRSIGRAEEFARQFGAPRAYGSYAELAGDPDVDAIYVASPHPFHMEHAVLCLQAGKAVLCEKPLAVNAAQARTMIAASHAAGSFLMEAMWTRYLPAVQAVREWIRAGRIGAVLRLEADFSFRGGWDPESRHLNPALAGGGLLDVGVYVIALAYWVFGQEPVEVKSMARIGKTGVDEQAAILFRYPDDALAVLTCGVRIQGPIHARITGTEGEIEIPAPFFRAENAILRKGGQEEVANHPHLANGYEYEAMEVARCVRGGLLESPDMSHAESLAIMKQMDSIRSGWGVRYPFEQA
jgi:predicted dehydrogenase